MNSNNNNQENGQPVVRVGSSLYEDSNKIQDLLSVDAAGIVITATGVDGKGLHIYRPTTPLKTQQEVVKTVRRFLVLVSVLGGLSLAPVKSVNEIPRKAVDFEQLCQTLRARSILNSRGDD